MSQDYLTVSAITKYLHYKIVKDPYLKKVYLEGEITNFRKRKSHQYFTLKDEEAAINITMFSSRFKEVDFELENGLKVVILGHIDLYEPNGTYSLIAHSMQLAGEGDLHKRFEEIKKRLTSEGLFAKPKRPLPKYPRKIAVITSQTGAVIHDIIRTINQRFPMTSLVLYPTLVQGPEAAENIALQINAVNQRASDYDLVIVGRGGGSYEDLFCFNEERVVRAAYDLKIPLVTSVGHETDYTLIDQVADYSAATPTMAAEQSVPDRMEEMAIIKQQNARLMANLRQKLYQVNESLVSIKQSRIFKNPEQIYNVQELKLQNLQAKLAKYRPEKIVASEVVTLEQYTKRLDIIKQQISILEQTLNTKKQKLEVLNPESVLKRGYAYVTKNKQTIESKAKLSAGDELELHFADGKVLVEVKGEE